MSSLIKTIEGVLDNCSSGTVSGSNANEAVKANQVHQYDYLEINGERWGNMMIIGSLNDFLEKSDGEKITLHYVEFVKDKAKCRLVAGIEFANGEIEATMVDDLEPAIKAMGLPFFTLRLFAIILWGIAGGLLSVAVGYNSDPILGWITFFGGFVGIFVLIAKSKRKKLQPFRDVLEFAKAHNKIR